MDFDWKVIVKGIAPTIATVLGGPLAGAGVAALSQALLGKKDGTEQEIAEVLKTADPDTLMKIKEADRAFDVKMKELEIDVYKLDATDRDSARKRESSVGDKTNRNLAYAVIGAFIAVTTAVLLGWAKVESTLAGTLIGYLSAKAEQVLAYYFGSSRGSAEKTALLAKAESIKEK